MSMASNGALQLEGTTLFSNQPTSVELEFLTKLLEVLNERDKELNGDQDKLPEWTITPIEIGFDEQIEDSSVWKGRWSGRQIAVKYFPSITDKDAFVTQVERWMAIKHECILPVFGGSSGTGPRPWYVVGPYMINGNIIQFLESDAGKKADKLLLLLQIAQGMEFLHSNEIPHGSLETSRILINESQEAFISIYHQMRSDDELQLNEHGWTVQRTRQDVNDFGKLMYEIFAHFSPRPQGSAKGSLAWKGTYRPETMPEVIWALVHKCWAPDRTRPQFPEIVTLLTAALHNQQPVVEQADIGPPQITEGPMPVDKQAGLPSSEPSSTGFPGFTETRTNKQDQLSATTAKRDIKTSLSLTDPALGKFFEVKSVRTDFNEHRDPVVGAARAVRYASMYCHVLSGMSGFIDGDLVSWIPRLNSAEAQLSDTLASARHLPFFKATALRLVARTASVLATFLRIITDDTKRIDLGTAIGMRAIFRNIKDTASLISMTSSRTTFFSMLHTRYTKQQFDLATQDLQTIISTLQIETFVSTASWTAESDADLKDDQDQLASKQEEVETNDQALLDLLRLKSEDQPHALQRLQRTLDTLLDTQAKLSSQLPAKASSSKTEPRLSALPESPVKASPSYEDSSKQDPTNAVTDIASGQQPSNTEAPVTPVTPRPLDLLELTASTQDVAMDRPADARKEVESVQIGEKDPTLKLAGPRTQSLDDAIHTKLDMLRDTLPSDGKQERRLVDLLAKAYDLLQGTSIEAKDVLPGERLGFSLISDTWKGRWEGRPVVIKRFNRLVDAERFRQVVDVWRQLQSPHIMPFFGASDTNEEPPWGLVSPFMSNGDILHYVGEDMGRDVNKIMLLHQVAEGMEYLHSRQVLHGALKGYNIVINDEGRPIITDFGLDGLKTFITTKSPPNDVRKYQSSGVRRWQSPQRLKKEPLTAADDVYSFGITMCELYLEHIPYGYVEEDSLRWQILVGHRPDRPPRMPQGVWDLCRRCWREDSGERPKFKKIVEILGDMNTTEKGKDRNLSFSSLASGEDVSRLPSPELEEDVRERPHDSEEHYEPGHESAGSSASSIHSVHAFLGQRHDFDRHKTERRYRHYLSHEFDDRLTIPLWLPSVVPIGAVGYTDHGQFVQLLDSVNPPPMTTGLPPMPYFGEFGLDTERKAVEVRGGVTRMFERLSHWNKPFGVSGKESSSNRPSYKRYSFQLKPGTEQASLIVDDAEFEICRDLSKARSYLSANIDWLLATFGQKHGLVREDIIMVVGVLRATNYAMSVSNFAPRTTLSFDVQPKLEVGKQWGSWTVKRETVVGPTSEPFEKVGDKSGRSLPGYEPWEGVQDVTKDGLQASVRVSWHSSIRPKEAVLLAKLRYAPGALDPSLYP